ncbi:MAG: DUF1501 domain-containing protein, partial [Phycisphaerales bacterium]|nr:DUF1501 domain-containing protein [Phycisphaerales bacterium]
MRQVESRPPVTRREALRQIGAGFGIAGFASVAGAAPSGNPWAVKQPHFPAKAKHVIFLFLNGGLSQIDSFDYKPKLIEYDGKPLPYEMPRTEFAVGHLMKSPFQFKQYGRNGTWVSELFPHMAEIIDELCIIRSMQSDIPNHGPGMTMMNTGQSRVGRPSMGSWITYGLGTENQNLPGYIVLSPAASGDGGSARWGSAFLPSVYQGMYVSDKVSDPRKQIAYLANEHLNSTQQRRQLNLLKSLNQDYIERLETAPELEATIQSMEIAFRMQTEAPDVFDIRKESETTRAAYGDGDFARGCLMARRLVESGVRMVQVYYGNSNDWDQHADIMGHKVHAAASDRPIAALIRDLKQRGLLDETLVLIGSEFGRTPVLNLGGFRSVHNGRDHNVHGFTYLLAGGGVKPGTI